MLQYLLCQVRDGGLEGEGDVLSWVIKVGVRERLCIPGEVSPLHELGHAEVLLRRPFTVTLATELAGPTRSVALLLLLFHHVWRRERSASAWWHTGVGVSDASVLPTVYCAVHAAAAVQQVVSQTGSFRQAEEISQLTRGETCVFCCFSHINHSPRQALLGHLSLIYTLFNCTWDKVKENPQTLALN